MQKRERINLGVCWKVELSEEEEEDAVDLKDVLFFCKVKLNKKKSF